MSNVSIKDSKAIMPFLT